MTAQIEQLQASHEDPRAARRRALWQLGVITVVGAALRFFALGSDSFWLDEAHTADFTTLTFSELWSYDPPYNKANPPGYIAFMKAWVQISRSDEWFRASSAIAGTLTIPVVYFIGARMGSRRGGLMAAALLAVAGFHVRYSQEARAYAILTLAVALILLACVQLVTQPNTGEADAVFGGRFKLPGRHRRPITWTHIAWWTYAIALGVALHLHNTSFTLPLTSSIGVGIWWLRARPPGFVKRWTLANLAGLLLWLPWLPGFLNQIRRVTTSFWAEYPSGRDLIHDFSELVKGYANRLDPIANALWVEIAVLVAVVVLIGVGVRNMAPRYRPLIVAFIVVHPLAELGYSLRRPVYIQRSLVWIMIAMVVAIGFATIRLRGGRLVTASVLLIAVPLTGTIGYHLAFEKAEWDQAAAIVAEQAEPGDTVLVMSPNNVIPFERYFDGDTLDVAVFGIPWDIPDREREGMTLLPSDFDRISEMIAGGEHVFLVLATPDKISNWADVPRFLESGFEEIARDPLEVVTVISYRRR